MKFNEKSSKELKGEAIKLNIYGSKPISRHIMKVLKDSVNPGLSKNPKIAPSLTYATEQADSDHKSKARVIGLDV